MFYLLATTEHMTSPTRPQILQHVNTVDSVGSLPTVLTVLQSVLSIPSLLSLKQDLFLYHHRTSSPDVSQLLPLQLYLMKHHKTIH